MAPHLGRLGICEPFSLHSESAWQTPGVQIMGSLDFSGESRHFLGKERESRWPSFTFCFRSLLGQPAGSEWICIVDVVIPME